MNKLKLFEKISNCNIYGISDLMDMEKIHQTLKLGNGGSWCRLDGKFGKKYKVMTIKQNGSMRFSWNIDQVEVREFKNRYKNLDYGPGVKIRYIKLFGFRNGIATSRSIREDIRLHYKNLPCVCCGSNHNIEIDHKNGLYNDLDVLNLKTQKTEHFQPLCKHCNDQKRTSINYTKKTHKRYPASKIPMLEHIGVDFTHGNEYFDGFDKNWSVGTFWYDPVEFLKCIFKLKT